MLATYGNTNYILQKKKIVLISVAVLGVNVSMSVNNHIHDIMSFSYLLFSSAIAVFLKHVKYFSSIDFVQPSNIYSS